MWMARKWLHLFISISSPIALKWNCNPKSASENAGRTLLSPYDSTAKKMVRLFGLREWIRKRNKTNSLKRFPALCCTMPPIRISTLSLAMNSGKSTTKNLQTKQDERIGEDQKSLLISCKISAQVSYLKNGSHSQIKPSTGEWRNASFGSITQL